MFYQLHGCLAKTAWVVINNELGKTKEVVVIT